MPRWDRKEFSIGPAGDRTRKKRKIKNKGGGGRNICAPKAKHGIVPTIFFISKLRSNLKMIYERFKY